LTKSERSKSCPPSRW